MALRTISLSLRPPPDPLSQHPPAPEGPRESSHDAVRPPPKVLRSSKNGKSNIPHEVRRGWGPRMKSWQRGVGYIVWIMTHGEVRLCCGEPVHDAARVGVPAASLSGVRRQSSPSMHGLPSVSTPFLLQYIDASFCFLQQAVSLIASSYPSPKLLC